MSLTAMEERRTSQGPAWSIKGVVKGSALGRWLLIPYRLKCAVWAAFPPVLRIAPWLFRSRELTNWSYDLTDLNRTCMALFLREITGIDHRQLLGYIAEVDTDARLKRHIRETTLASRERHTADPDCSPGRRLLYYVLVRATRPKLVIEAGIDKGLGSCLIGKALTENHREGHPGAYIGVDRRPGAGYLFRPPYSDRGTIVCGDIVAFLESGDEPIDLYFHDTGTDPALERAEFERVAGRLAPRGIITSPWNTPELVGLAQRKGLGHLTFKDEPRNHWHRGDNIGVAFERAR